MWFKNLQLFVSDNRWTLNAAEFEERLQASTLQPVSGLQWSSEGWLSPRGDAQLVFGQDRQLLFAYGEEKKLLPGPVIRDQVASRAQTFEQVKGFAPSRKHLRELKEQVTTELLPRAFGQRKVTRAWIDPERGLLAIDAASVGTAESLLALLGRTVEGNGFAPLGCEPSVGAQMTQWLASGEAPEPFALDDECELVSPQAQRPAVRYARHSLDLPEIRTHLSAGKFVQRLRLSWRDQLRFTLDDQMQVKRVQVEESASDSEADSDPDAAFAADFMLMCSTLGPMIDDLRRVLNAGAE
ncbi:recombination-associated protein RdgC [Algiphilus sp.]|uniref:recombination-associated protein RdgC n=1 Tax=Algiphilus sp. TaxID=1872431 RepID=UPI0025C71F7F|nr:recombination-associated protein RdgC [Algiphilus sp.]MCK5768959.1 recombination-associated protein RdgC [Algiphilus sp.]